jgi:5-methylcytosine-specific restriction endonuclease McrA
LTPETVPNALRRLIFDRAEGRCEYCLISQSIVAHKHEPDHIILKQHGGQTALDNMALACAR